MKFNCNYSGMLIGLPIVILYFLRLSLLVCLKSAGCGWNVKCLLPLTSMACISTRDFASSRLRVSQNVGGTRRREEVDSSMNVEEVSSVVVDTAFHLHRGLGPGLHQTGSEQTSGLRVRQNVVGTRRRALNTYSLLISTANER